MAFAQRKQLHHFACKIFVRCALAVLRTIKVNQHRRIFRYLAQHRTKVAGCIVAQHDVLPIHQVHRAHFLLRSGKVVVPKKRHFFSQWRRRRQHLGNPPSTKLQTPLNEFTAIGLRSLLLRHVGFKNALVFRSPRGSGISGGAARLMQQPVHRLLSCELGVIIDLTGLRGEAGAVEQMARLIKAHAGR